MTDLAAAAATYLGIAALFGLAAYILWGER